MARPSKSVETMSKHLTKDEIRIRSENQNKLKGNSDNIIPSQELNENQLFLFNFIKDELRESGILSNLDTFILTKCVISIDRLQYIEKIINDKPQAILNKDLMSAKDKYDKDFYRCCNELSLSPQSRAKIANINKEAIDKEEDPVIRALKGEL
ncbi:MAG: P27 family phage terminase small subunit [Clostridium sp.]|nr:P27 family phage terminase small subunit [Clostridium sp.]